MKPTAKLAVGFAAANMLWLLLYLWLNTRIVPSPLQVYARLAANWQTLLLHAAASIGRAAAGLAISAVIGIAVGVCMGQFAAVNRILAPLLYLAYPIPKTALLPILMLLFGLGDSSKILLVVLISVFQVTVAVRDGAAALDKDLYAAATSMGAGKLSLLLHITLPTILPNILSAIRVCAATALSVLFFAEGYGTTLGLGYYIHTAWARLDYVDMYCGIVAISIAGATAIAIIDAAEEILYRK